ncbi:MAG: HAMP domain-containing protein [Deltaproteobacteria bacterium]|nr:HAMP domain-containing protein [Deltaproteobacteria bacterium]
MFSSLHKKSVHTNILLLVLGIISIGAAVWLYLDYRAIKNSFINEKRNTSKLIAKAIVDDIYEDMMEGRPDLVRYLMDDLSSIEAVEKIQIIRNNGKEQAFRDLKTIDAVREKIGQIPEEWYEVHDNFEGNSAEDVDTIEFKEAFKGFKEAWSSKPVFYFSDEGFSLTYLHPIIEKKECLSCHTQTGARGLIMVKTSLSDMQNLLSKNISIHLIFFLITLPMLGFLLSYLIKKSITGPLNKAVSVIARIEKSRNLSERISIDSEDEIGFLADGFNSLLGTLEGREVENEELLKVIEKGKKEWETTFDAIEDLISIQDKKGYILRVNEAFASKFGMSTHEAVGKEYYKLVYGLEKALSHLPHSMTLLDGKSHMVESFEPVLDANVSTTAFPLFGSNGLVATVSVIKDITEENLLKDKLIHSEKMSSLGNFVTGIAHEINNPLTGIMGFSQILMEVPVDKPVGEIKDKISKIYQEALRTQKILQGLLTFASVKKPKWNKMDMNAVINDTVDLKEYGRMEDFKLVLDLEEELPTTMGDFFLLQQVFINLVNNAIYAAKEKGATPTVIIKTSHVKNIIRVEVSDNGIGIAEDVIDKVFDPFFTTKTVGDGTGLGLSICHSIVKDHHGWIEVRLVPQGGTSIIVDLPIIESKALS